MPSTRAGAVTVASLVIAAAVAIVAASGPRRPEAATHGQRRLASQSPARPTTAPSGARAAAQ